MRVKKYLGQVAYKTAVMIMPPDESEVYQSKFDDSYITHVGMEKDVKFLADKEITEELTHGVGFSPKDGKWYGWSHRAIFGFKIGSTCEKGDCHYVGSTEKEQEEDAIRFWSEDDHQNTRCVGIKEDDNGDRFFQIKWDYTDKIPNKKLRGKIGGSSHYITPLGRGEWIAKTVSDAKQMAVDFNEGVS